MIEIRCPTCSDGAVQLWEGADRLWRYRYVQSGSPRPILSNRGYPSKEEAIQSAELAYPGVWLRPDVYATHGHYVDLHITVPSFERRKPAP